MLAIEVNGEFLETSGELKTEFERYSPIFQTEGIIKDDKTIPFKLPNTDQNAKVLKYPAMLESLETFSLRYEAKIWENGVPMMAGQLRVEKADSKDQISAYFTYGLSEIATDIATRPLRDIMDEEVVIHSTDYDKRVKLYFREFADAVCSLEVNGVTYSADTVTDLVAAINADTEQSASAVYDSTVTGGGRTLEYITLIPGSASELDPFDFNFTPIGPEEDGSGITGSYWTVQEIEFEGPYLTTYQNFVNLFRGATPDRRLRFCEFANFHDFKLDGSIKKYPIVNYYSDGELAGNYINQDTGGTRLVYVAPKTVNNTSLAPQVTIRYIFEKIEEYFDVKIKFPMLDDYPDDDLLVISPNTLDVPLKYFKSERFIFYKRSFNIKDFVPDIPVNEFLKSLQSLGFYIQYNSLTRTIEFKERNSVVSNPDYIDMTGKHSELRDIVKAERTGVRLSHMIDKDNIHINPIEFEGDGSNDYYFRDGGRDVTTRLSVPDVSNPSEWPSDSENDIVVTINQPPKEDFALKIAYKSNYGEYLDTWVFGRSLTWEDSFDLFEGLYSRYWNNWVVMEDNPITAKVTLFVPSTWAWTPFWNQKILIDRNKFLIKSFQVVIDESELLQLECDLVNVPYAVRSVSNPGVPIGVPEEEGIPVNPIPDPIPDPDPIPEELGDAIELEAYGGSGYYKSIQSGLSYAIDGTDTIITSSTGIFTTLDAGKKFCGLFAHVNPDTPDGNLFYPRILGSRYATITEVISATQIRVDFAFNTGSTKGYIFHDNSDALIAALAALDTAGGGEIRLRTGKTYVVPEFVENAIGVDVLIKGTNSSIKLGWEDFYAWNGSTPVDQAGFVFNLSNGIDLVFDGVDIIPPHRTIQESQTRVRHLFKNAPSPTGSELVALKNCNFAAEYESLTHITEENCIGLGLGFMYSGNDVHIGLSNSRHRGPEFMAFKANNGGGIYPTLKDVELYNPDSFNPNATLVSGTVSGNTFTITSNHSNDLCRTFYGIRNGVISTYLHIGRFVFYLDNSSFPDTKTVVFSVVNNGETFSYTKVGDSRISTTAELHPGDVLDIGTIVHKQKSYVTSGEQEYELDTAVAASGTAEMITSSMSLSGAHDAYLIYKGNAGFSSPFITTTTTFGAWYVLLGSRFGHTSYNHKEISPYWENFVHNGFYRQSDSGVGTSDYYILKNCSGLADQFDPPVTPTDVGDMPARMAAYLLS